MTREYLADKEYTINQLNEIIDGMELLYAQTDENSIIQLVAGSAVAGLAFWVTAPIGVAIGGLVASLFLDFYGSYNNTRAVIGNGLYDLKDLAYTMYRYGYDRARFRSGILEVTETSGTVKIYESAMATAFHSGTGWHLAS